MSPAVSLRRPGFEGAAFRLPFVETAVEHRGVLEAERFEHPPEPRRPHRRADRVEHHPAVVADAVAAERRLELRDIGHHEAKLGILDRRTRPANRENPRPEYARPRTCAARARRYRERRCLRAGFEIGRAIEQPQIGLMQMPASSAVVISPSRSRMCSPPAYFVRCYGAASGDEKAAGNRATAL